MNTAQIADQHARYYAAKMPQFLASKSSGRIAAAIEWTGHYASNVLPGLIIDRSDPVVLATKEETHEQ